MLNRLPDMNLVAARLNSIRPTYLVQVIHVNAVDGGRFYIAYIQDILTFKIVDFKTFDSALKTNDAALFVLHFAKSLDILDLTIFVFLKTTPFSNQKFLDLMEAGNLNCSFYNRADALKVYETQKVHIKQFIILDPDNVSKTINLWNDIAPGKLAVLKRCNEKSPSLHNPFNLQQLILLILTIGGYGVVSSITHPLSV